MAFMRQAGQSKKTAEARLSLEERKAITILIQFFSFLKMCIFLAPSVYIRMLVCIYGYLYVCMYVCVCVCVCVFTACIITQTNKCMQHNGNTLSLIDLLSD
jgi:ABC-type transport system involved in Fe-S cluster assembly fused permease/ATPase subunit